MVKARLGMSIFKLLRFAGSGLLASCVALSGIGAQVPSFPVQPEDMAIAAQIRSALEGKDAKLYSDMLADTLQVYEDGRLIAKSKREWIERFTPKLRAEGVVFNMTSGFVSNGRVLYIEYFNSAGSWGGTVPAHCCWSYDAVSYDIANGKIAVIRRLTGGGDKL